MKIKNRLRLSYILMLLVPVMLIMITGMVMRDHYEDGPSWSELPEAFLSELYGTISDNPERLLSSAHLRELGELGGREGLSLVVFRGGKKVSSASYRQDGPGRFSTTWDFYFSDGASGRLSVFIKEHGMMRGRFIQNGLFFLLVIFVLVLTNGVLSYFVAGSISKPLNNLNTAALRIKNEDLDTSFEYKGGDEFQEVFTSFEQMRIRLRDSLHEQIKAEDNRKELLSSISHDLKTPITTIKGYIEGIRDGIADSPEKVEKYIDTVYRKSILMNELIDSLFLFSKLDLNRVQFNFRKLDLSIFLRDICDELKFDYPELEIVLDGDGQPAVAAADSMHLHRVIANLVDNAVKYRGEHEPRILVSITRSVNHIELCIKDNGRGIAEADLPHIFERFYRSDPARSSEVEGSGLGLAISKQIISAHGGRIKAESRPGDGTAVTIILKAAE